MIKNSEYLNKKSFFIFIIFGIIVWSASWWAYALYMKAVDAVRLHEYEIIKMSSMAYVFLSLIYILSQAIIFKKKGYRYPKLIGRILLSCAGLSFIALLAMPQQRAERIDMVFIFILATISKFTANKIDLKRPFVSLLVMWFFIICINESIQHFFLFLFRYGSLNDVFNSTMSVLIALLISI